MSCDDDGGPTMKAMKHVYCVRGVFQLPLPEVLLDYYLSMVDPSRAQTVDTDIMCHCAHCLPAVLFTVGRRHWPYLSQLFHTLASSLQVITQTFYVSHIQGGPKKLHTAFFAKLFLLSIIFHNFWHIYTIGNLQLAT